MRSVLVSSLVLGIAASFMGSLAACSVAGDDSASDEAAVKKKVTPTGGNGEFDYVKPANWPSDVVGTATFAGAEIAVGGSAQRTPGTYAIEIQSNSNDYGLYNERAIVQLEAGGKVSKQATAVRVRFDTPVTLGGAQVRLLGSVSLEGTGAWAKNPKGIAMLVLEGTTRLDISSQVARIENFAVPEGGVTEVVLPTTPLHFQLDDIDPTYPSPPKCTPPNVTAGGAGANAKMDARNADGTASPDQVIPQGDNAPVVVDAYGFKVTYKTEQGKPTNVTLNRLEVDHVQVAGASAPVPGTYVVKVKDPLYPYEGGWRTLSCTDIPTHTGLDLPDGQYRVYSQATTASGPISHFQEVSFP